MKIHNNTTQPINCEEERYIGEYAEKIGELFNKEIHKVEINSEYPNTHDPQSVYITFKLKRPLGE